MSAPEKTVAAFRALFLRPDPDGTMCVRPGLLHQDFLTRLSAFLERRGDAAAADYWNFFGELYVDRTLDQVLCECFFDALTLAGAAGAKHHDCAVYLLEQAETLHRALWENARSEADAGTLSPQGKRFVAALGPGTLSERVAAADPLGAGGVFAYHRNGFRAIRLNSIRPVDAFFGYEGPRRHFEEAIGTFAAGKGNAPLLVSSLPGHGKTQMTIAYTLAHPNLTLILPEAGILSDGLPELLERLGRRDDRKFVVFFDDIIPDEVNFYDFRTHVGGAYAPPEHILLILASNDPFPPSILSRGRGIGFPTFDEVRCMEMVSDFLVSLGMAHPRENLISMIAADYTEDFGQKKFSELSPRTLVRYLERYRTDRRKRMNMLELSRGELITKPDAQLFYDFNIDLMRRLYGKEYIEALLKEKLRDLGN